MSTEIEKAVQDMCKHFNTIQSQKDFKYHTHVVYFKIYTELRTTTVKDPPSTSMTRSAYCFIKRSDGTIWKPEGWSRPAKNFPRGNVLDPKTYKNFTPYGL